MLSDILRGTAVFTVAACGACSDAPPVSQATNRWQVEQDPVTRISSADANGEAAFEFARSGTRLPDGTVVVVDQYAASVRFFDADGRVASSFGRRGRGPGEFADPRSICRIRDELHVWDYVRRTMIVLDHSGAFRREYRPEMIPHEVSCSVTGWIAMLGLPTEFYGPNDDGLRSPAPLWIADSNGRNVASLDQVPFGENRGLGKLTRIAAGEELLFIGTSDSAWVDALDTSGEHMGGVALGVSKVPTATDYELAIEEMLSVVPSRDARDRYRADYAALARPELAPAYRELRVDPMGWLWAVTSLLGDSVTVVNGTNPIDGQTAELRLPQRFQLFEIGTDHVVGVVSDAVGEQQVVVYRFQRGRGSQG